jgi:hypothetical protein
LDELGRYREPLSDGDEGGDAAIIRFVAVGAAREEEITVDFVRVGLELCLENSVGLVALLSFESMGDFAVVDGGDEAVSNRVDHLVEVGLCGEDVNRGLWRHWGVVWSELCDRDRVGDRVEQNGENGRGQRSGGGRLIGQIDGRHSVMEEGIIGVDAI